MKLIKVTIEQVLNSDKKDYNVTEWTKKVKRFAEMQNVQFYYVPSGNGYDYERFFVSYTIPNEMNVFCSFGYGSVLTNNSFVKVIIDNDGNLKTEKLSYGIATGFRIANNTAGRKYMTAMSNNFAMCFSNEF